MIFSSPEEANAALKKQADLMRMSAEDQVAQQTAFFESLSVDDLLLIRNVIRGASQDPSYGQFINGWTSHLLSSKYKVCGFCDAVHEEMTPEAVIAAHGEKTGESQ